MLLTNDGTKSIRKSLRTNDDNYNVPQRVYIIINVIHYWRLLRFPEFFCNVEHVKWVRDTQQRDTWSHRRKNNSDLLCHVSWPMEKCQVATVTSCAETRLLIPWTCPEFTRWWFLTILPATHFAKIKASVYCCLQLNEIHHPISNLKNCEINFLATVFAQVHSYQ